MRLIALKPIRVKTSKGPVEIQPGDIFNPVDSRPFIEEGIAEPVTQETFKKTFNRLSEHLRQRDYDPENFAKLQTLSLEMDQAWNSLNYPTFRKVIEEMMRVPGTLKPEGMKTIACKIYSHILQDTVWIAIDPTFQTDDGIAIYTPDEIRGLRGTDPDVIRQIYWVKRNLGGRLIMAKDGKEKHA